MVINDTESDIRNANRVVVDINIKRHKSLNHAFLKEKQIRDLMENLKRVMTDKFKFTFKLFKIAHTTLRSCDENS